MLIPSTAFAQYMGNVGSEGQTGSYTLEEALEIQTRRIVDTMTQYEIPAWVKGVAGFWAEGKISDKEFGEGLSFLIDSGIIKIPKIQELENRISQLENENRKLQGLKNYEYPYPVQPTQDAPGAPENAGALGSEHSHAALLVKIFGDTFEFTNPAFQIKSSWIHFEGGDGSTIHKHATGVDLGYLFETLAIGLDDQCYVFPDGKQFCTNEDYTLKFFINREQVSDIRDYEIMEDDRILIVFGAETSEEIAAYLLELDRQVLIK